MTERERECIENDNKRITTYIIVVLFNWVGNFYFSIMNASLHAHLHKMNFGACSFSTH